MEEDSTFDLFELADEVQSDKTQFHGGFDKLKRLDRILMGINKIKIPIANENLEAKAFRYSTYLSLINDLLSELYPQMSKDQKEESLMEFQSISTEFEDFFRTLKGKGNKILFTEKLRNKFMLLELKLRDIQHEKGMDMPKKQGVYEFMAGGN